MALNPHAPPFSVVPNQDPNHQQNMQHHFMMQPQQPPPQGYGAPQQMQGMPYNGYGGHDMMYSGPPYGQPMNMNPMSGGYKNPPMNPRQHQNRQNQPRPPRQFGDNQNYLPQQRSQPIQPPLTPPQQPSFVRKIIMMCGYRYSGKTTVAQAIAEEKKFTYLSLEPNDTDENEDKEIAFMKRFDPLIDALKNPFTGLVLDNVICSSKYDAYYVNHIVASAGYNINAVVMLECDLEDVKERGDEEYLSPAARILHPESYEFSATFIDSPTIVNARLSVEETVKSALFEVNKVLQTNTKVIFHPVNFIPNCPLVTEPNLVTAVLSAQANVLGITQSTFPYSEPNFLLDYSTFARNGFQFTQYMVTPWIDGDKVAVVGYNGKVYIHLPSYCIVFELKSVPAALAALLSEATAGTPPNPTTPASPSTSFSFAATMLDDVIYISELLYVGDKLGTRMQLHERVEMLRGLLGSLPQDSNVRALEWYTLSAVQECIDTYASIPIAGVILTNPRPVRAGLYDSLNFPFPLEDKKRVSLRIWGLVHSDDESMWCFDAYGRQEGEDSIVLNRPIIISDADVSALCINDGNIVECECEEIPAPPTRGKKPQRHPGYRYKFVCRRKWMLEPVTLHLEQTCFNSRDWPQKRFIEACKCITYCEPKLDESRCTSVIEDEMADG